MAKALLVASLGAFTCANSHGDDQDLPLGEDLEVTRVIDGDTIEVSGVGRVRLLGIDAPESVHPRLQVQPCGLDAAVSLHQIVYRRRVRLEVSPHAGVDRYGRLLAVVYVQSRVGSTNVNLRMVRKGFARVVTGAPKEYEQAEALAMQEKIGIWSERPCQRN